MPMVLEPTTTFRDFITNLKAELRLTNLGLAKRIDIPTKIILDIETQKTGIDNLELGVYRKLISLKNWNRNYLYEPFIPKSSSKNLVEGFADFVKKIMQECQVNLQDIANLQEEITVDFVSQITNGEIHPDRVNLLFIKKLLILEGALSEKQVHDYYFRPVLDSEFTPYEVTRFKEFVLDLRNRILHVSQRYFAEQLGVSGGTVSLWEKGKTNPDSIKIEHFRSLADLKGWTVEELINYIYGNEDQVESYEVVFSKAKNLPTIFKIKLAQELLALAEEGLIYQSLEKFSQIIKNYIEEKNLSLEEASKRLRIKPVSRLESLLNQKELPTNMEVLRLSSLPDFLKESGDRYTYDELKTMIYGITNENQ